jgi:predicted enzyme related to lactoylglutathione lyase
MDHGTVTTVMHDTSDLDGTPAFWQELLGLELLYRDASYVYLSPLSEGGPHLAFQLVPEAKATKNRLHLDVRVADRGAFVDRVQALGGSVVGEQPGQDGVFPPWTVMADPEGNEFCIYEPQQTDADTA